MNNNEPGPNGNNLAGKMILIVNSYKKSFTKKVKNLGVKVIVLDKELSGPQPYIDYFIQADNYNHNEAINAVDNFIKEHPEIKIDGVMTFWEDDVLLTSKLADKFHLIGIPYKVANRARNKFLFREFCQQHGLPTVKHQEIKNNRDLEEVISNFKFPVVIKPSYGAASAFVFKANDPEELRDSYAYIKKEISHKVESALNDGLGVFVEEYIDGDEVDLDMIIQNGKVKFCSISDNSKTKEPFFVETTRLTPSNLPLKNRTELLKMADEVLEKLGVYQACVHFEAKSTAQGPVPIEVNLRLGGDEIHPSVKAAYHFDLIEAAVKVALGVYIAPVEPFREPYKYLLAETFSSDYSGILVNLDIDEDLKKKEFVEEFQFEAEIGDSIMAPPNGYDYLGWMMVSGEHPVDAQDNLATARQGINYEIARFHPASSLGKTERKNHVSFSALNKEFLKRRGKIEKIRRLSISNQRSLHIGVAGNLYQADPSQLDYQESVKGALSSVSANIKNTLEARGYRVSFFDFNDLPQAFNDLKNSDVDLVFNVCERINDSSLLEPHAASVLDTLQIPYTGSNPFTLGLCIDKIKVKKLLSYHKIPTPEWDYVYSLDDDIRSDLKYPLMVKPANTDDSIGITNDSVVTDKEGLYRELKKIIVDLGRPALIEEYIDGDEYDVPIIGSTEDDLRVLPLSRSIFDNMPPDYWHIYTFEAKYSQYESVYDKCIIKQEPPKNISKKLESLLSEIALDTYNILDCHDYGRVEIKVDKNDNPYVLELNPNPSINITDCLSRSSKLVGFDYGDFLEEIIRLAINRYKNNDPYFHLQSNLL